MTDKASKSVEYCEVLIVGGGPVGLTVACELGRRAVPCLVIDDKEGFHAHPRATFLGPRTMEYFRSWGIADKVLDRAVPADYPIDVAFTETAATNEVGRLVFPTIAEMRSREQSSLERFAQLAWSRYAKVVIGQNDLEPVLFEATEAYPSIENRKGLKLVSFEEFDDCVVSLLERDDGSSVEVRSNFLIGCDGGRSVVRQGLGAIFDGIGEVGRSVNTYFDCPDLLSAIKKKPASIFWSLKPGATGAILAVDGRRKWVFSRHLLADEQYSDDVDPSESIRAAIGAEVQISVISSWFWIPRQLVSSSYGNSRVFLAGDAAHLMSPTGGYGLNTGIADAVNLAWKIAAFVHGWGRAGLLDSYEIERKPMAIRASKEATDNRAFTKEVLKTGALLGYVETREHAIRFISRTMSRHGKHFDGNGIYLGDRYDESPAISQDDSPPVPWDAEVYVPTSRPGGRLPLEWVDANTTLHDLCGLDFTLFTQDVSSTVSLQEAFSLLGVPLHVVDLRGKCRSVCAENLLVRPDNIVAWRGQTPTNPAELVGRLVGFPALASTDHAFA